MNARSFSRAFALFSVLLFAILLLWRTSDAGQLIREGALLAYTRVLPAVFPTLVLVGLMLRSGAAEVLGRLSGGGFCRLFGLPRAAFPAVFIGLLAGFPYGARSAAELYAAGVLSARDAERIAAFCDFCGLPFLLSAVGGAAFGDVRIGWLMYACQTSAALLFGFFYRRPRGGQRRSAPPRRTAEFSFSDLGAVIGEAVTGTLRIFGFVILFALLIGLISPCLEPLFGTFPDARTLVYGFFEISSGVSALGGGGEEGRRLFLCALMTCFSGLSVCGQVTAELQSKGLSARGFFAARLFCPPVSALLSVLAAWAFGLL